MGEGGLLLMAAISDYRDESQSMRAVGYEIDEGVAALARARFFLYDVEAEVHIGDSLRVPQTELPAADFILLDPPMGQQRWGDADVYLDRRWKFGLPPPNNADFAWLQLAAGAIEPGGRALVLLPASALVRGGREGEIRARMVATGIIEAVITLPPRLRPEVSAAVSIWVLRSQDDVGPGVEMLLVDATSLGESGRSQYSLPEESIDRLAALFHRWQDHSIIAEADSGIAVPVSINRAAEAAFSLEAHTYLSPPEVDVEPLRRQAFEIRNRLGRSTRKMTVEIDNLIRSLENRG
jgi:type I restriction enzyme M protein